MVLKEAIYKNKPCNESSNNYHNPSLTTFEPSIRILKEIHPLTDNSYTNDQQLPERSPVGRRFNFLLSIAN